MLSALATHQKKDVLAIKKKNQSPWLMHGRRVEPRISSRTCLCCVYRAPTQPASHVGNLSTCRFEELPLMLSTKSHHTYIPPLVCVKSNPQMVDFLKQKKKAKEIQRACNAWAGSRTPKAAYKPYTGLGCAPCTTHAFALHFRPEYMLELHSFRGAFRLRAN
jgi:hypothetical protein